MAKKRKSSKPPKDEVRAMTLFVNKPLNLTWEQLNKALDRAWQESVRLANFAVETMRRGDIVRTPTMKTLPVMPKVDPYTIGFTKRGYYAVDYWKGCKASVAAIIRSAGRRYFKHRAQAIWSYTGNAPVYKSFPFPVHTKAWKAAYENGKPVVTFKLPVPIHLSSDEKDKSGKRWWDSECRPVDVRLELRDGRDFHRQLPFFKRIAEGELDPTMLYVGKQRCGSNASHSIKGREDGSGEQVSRKIKVIFSAKVLVAPVKKSGLIMTLKTDPAAFWVAEVPDRPAWVYNADHVQQMMFWVKRHRAYLDRLAQDTKHEVRRNKSKRSVINGSRSRRCDKQAKRLKSFLNMISSAATSYAVRNHVKTVVYDDGLRDYLPSFPWAELRDCLERHLVGVGINLMVRDEKEEAKPKRKGA